MLVVVLVVAVLAVDRVLLQSVLAVGGLSQVLELLLADHLGCAQRGVMQARHGLIPLLPNFLADSAQLTIHNLIAVSSLPNPSPAIHALEPVSGDRPQALSMAGLTMPVADSDLLAALLLDLFQVVETAGGGLPGVWEIAGGAVSDVATVVLRGLFLGLEVVFDFGVVQDRGLLRLLPLFGHRGGLLNFRLLVALLHQGIPLVFVQLLFHILMAIGAIVQFVAVRVDL